VFGWWIKIERANNSYDYKIKTCRKYKVKMFSIMFYNSIYTIILHSNAVCGSDHQTMYLFKYAICSSEVHIKNIGTI